MRTRFYRTRLMSPHTIECALDISVLRRILPRAAVRLADLGNKSAGAADQAFSRSIDNLQKAVRTKQFRLRCRGRRFDQRRILFAGTMGSEADSRHLHEQQWSIEPLGAGHFNLHFPDGRQRRTRLAA